MQILLSVHDQICIYAKFAYTQNGICTWSEAGANFSTFAYVQILHTEVNAYTWPDLRTYANFAYMQNLHTYANLVMCTGLKLANIIRQLKTID